MSQHKNKAVSVLVFEISIIEMDLLHVVWLLSNSQCTGKHVGCQMKKAWQSKSVNIKGVIMDNQLPDGVTVNSWQIFSKLCEKETTAVGPTALLWSAV